MTSHGTADFWELYHGLPPQTQDAARKAFQKFLENPAHPSLQLERLRSDSRAWSVRGTRNYRAVARHYDDDWLWFGSARTKNSTGCFPSDRHIILPPAILF